MAPTEVNIDSILVIQHTPNSREWRIDQLFLLIQTALLLLFRKSTGVWEKTDIADSKISYAWKTEPRKKPSTHKQVSTAGIWRLALDTKMHHRQQPLLTSNICIHSTLWQMIHNRVIGLKPPDHVYALFDNFSMFQRNETIPKVQQIQKRIPGMWTWLLFFR